MVSSEDFDWHYANVSARSDEKYTVELALIDEGENVTYDAAPRPVSDLDRAVNNGAFDLDNRAYRREFVEVCPACGSALT